MVEGVGYGSNIRIQEASFPRKRYVTTTLQSTDEDEIQSGVKYPYGIGMENSPDVNE